MTMMNVDFQSLYDKMVNQQDEYTNKIGALAQQMRAKQDPLGALGMLGANIIMRNQWSPTPNTFGAVVGRGIQPTLDYMGERRKTDLAATQLEAELAGKQAAFTGDQISTLATLHDKMNPEQLQIVTGKDAEMFNLSPENTWAVKVKSGRVTDVRQLNKDVKQPEVMQLLGALNKATPGSPEHDALKGRLEKLLYIPGKDGSDLNADEGRDPDGKIYTIMRIAGPNGEPMLAKVYKEADENGNVRIVPITDENGNPVMDAIDSNSVANRRLRVQQQKITRMGQELQANEDAFIQVKGDLEEYNSISDALAIATDYNTGMRSTNDYVLLSQWTATFSSPDSERAPTDAEANRITSLNSMLQNLGISVERFVAGQHLPNDVRSAMIGMLQSKMDRLGGRISYVHQQFKNKGYDTIERPQPKKEEIPSPPAGFNKVIYQDQSFFQDLDNILDLGGDLLTLPKQTKPPGLDVPLSPWGTEP